MFTEILLELTKKLLVSGCIWINYLSSSAILDPQHLTYRNYWRNLNILIDPKGVKTWFGFPLQYYRSLGDFQLLQNFWHCKACVNWENPLTIKELAYLKPNYLNDKSLCPPIYKIHLFWPSHRITPLSYLPP